MSVSVCLVGFDWMEPRNPMEPSARRMVDYIMGVH